MIKPLPFKYKCPKCNYSKVVSPKSDVLNPMDFMSVCPKCSSTMERKELDLIDNIVSSLFGK